MNQKKIGNLIYISCFLLVILFPLLKTNTEPDFTSEIDNRKLTEFPAFGEKNYSSKIESYIQDRIGFRNEMVNAYAVLHDELVNELTHPSYVYGKDGYVFFNMHKNIVYGDYHKTFAEMVLKMQEYCESRGAEFYFMFEPEKISTLRQYLPEGVHYEDTWTDKFLSYTKELGVNVVDNAELLAEKSTDEQVFNITYDAGHWNDLGCFYATNNVLKEIHKDIPEVTELSKDEFEITTAAATKLPVSDFTIYEEVPSFKPKTTYTNVTKEHKKYVPLNSQYTHYHYYINDAENADQLPKMMIFQGSYYNSRPQYFVSRTSEDIGIHNYQNVLNLDTYFNMYQPDVVVFEVAEYTFSDKYFDQEKMKAIDWNPSLFADDTQEAFEIKKEKLLQQTTRLDVNAELTITKKGPYEQIKVSRIFKDAKYMYLITDHSVFDVHNGKNDITALLPSGELNSGNAVLFVRETDGTEYYCSLRVKQ